MTYIPILLWLMTSIYSISTFSIQSVKEYDIDPSISFKNDEGLCPNGAEWQYQDGYCYTFVEEAKSWFAAEMDCRDNYGGSLLTLKLKGENGMVNRLTNCQYNIWLGMVTTVHNSQWKWWDTGDPISGTPPSLNERHPYYDQDCSVFIPKNEQYYSTFCTRQPYSYVCKRQASPRAVKKVHSCPPGWTGYRSNCYWFSQTTANYFHAQMKCEELGGRVVAVENRDEHYYLQMQHSCTAKDRYWIGLEKTRPCIKNEVADCWEWIERSPYNFSNWARDFPRNNAYDCTYSYGFWYNDVACSEKLRFVCKRESSVITTTTQQNTTTTTVQSIIPTMEQMTSPTVLATEQPITDVNETPTPLSDTTLQSNEPITGTVPHFSDDYVTTESDVQNTVQYDKRIEHR